MELTTLFGQIDDFWADFEAQYYQHLMADGRIKRVRKSRLSLSEVMTIIIQVQRSAYRTFILSKACRSVSSLGLSATGVLPSICGKEIHNVYQFGI
ncbi:TPA: hypothetical protein EYN98_24385 [Candidatus Poribacteria bacterium]|nr:hypothetical protein [Candidatus Poribacteria bacterium]HIN28253.1 hypothetical protein [Candidatus Poribacteria bacterium]